jgi:hypothetical protein
MWEGLVVGTIVGVAAFFAGRAVYRSLTGKNKARECGSNTCPMDQSGSCNPSKERDKERCPRAPR